MPGKEVLDAVNETVHGAVRDHITTLNPEELRELAPESYLASGHFDDDEFV